MFLRTLFCSLGLSLALLVTALSSVTESITVHPEVFKSTVEKRRADPLEPCSIPTNADSSASYPDFPQCRDGSCPPCEARSLGGKTRGRQKIKLRTTSFPAKVVHQGPVTRPQPGPQQPVTRPQPGPQQPVTRPQPGPQQPVTRLQLAPEQPVTRIQLGSQQPVTRLQLAPEQPVTRIQLGSQQPVTRPQLGPQQLVTGLKLGPQQPVTRLQFAPQQPVTRPQLAPQQSVTRLKLGPQQPVTRLKLGPQQPVTRLQLEPQQPVTRLQVTPQRPATIGSCPQPSLPAAFDACLGMVQPQTRVQTFQCPPGPVSPPFYDRNQIINIIYKLGNCQAGGLQCDVSIKELMVRLALLHERLRRLQDAENKVRIYTELLNQIKTKIDDGQFGKPGRPGPPGLDGQPGGRGRSGPVGRCRSSDGQNMVAGPSGPPGARGKIGPPGDKVCGCDGDQGDAGFPGYSYGEQVGPRGPKGYKGVRGRSYSPPSIKDDCVSCNK
ncbi:hypothetical protein FHG87_000287 [Trinorchestia longiramus]|nr:hypothetical protein FHG87_000287 [Trinorchestia longiramus]